MPSDPHPPTITSNRLLRDLRNTSTSIAEKKNVREMKLFLEGLDAEQLKIASVMFSQLATDATEAAKKVARDARRQAEYKAESARRKLHLKAWHNIGPWIAQALDNGRTFDNCLSTLQAQGFDDYAVKLSWTRYQKQLTKQHRRRRARRIMQLRSRGLKDAEIGQKVGMHPSSVNRIMKGELDREQGR